MSERVGASEAPPEARGTSAERGGRWRRVDADVLVVGAGFAGSILARALAAGGLSVCLIERGSHPRFALGESTTPLANLALERLAARFGLVDLHHLAAYGRWQERLPELGRGLKRGFTFYAHRTGEDYVCGADNVSRLLVAASPDDAVADTHWLRADVDAHLVERACAEGVIYLDRAEVETLEREGGPWRCRGTRDLEDPAHESMGRGRRSAREPFLINARVVVDASGAGGFLKRHLELAASAREPLFQSRLLYAHFAGVPPFSSVGRGLPDTYGPHLDSPGIGRRDEPYPEHHAAVHHLFDVGWQYQLRFDDGVTSAGILVCNDRLGSLGPIKQLFDTEPEAAFYAVLERYPSLALQFTDARAVTPVVATPVLQRRLQRAAGPGWYLLPHTFAFLDPLFSTGIAWSLLAVERLADLLLDTPRTDLGGADWAAYDALLQRECDHLEQLIATGYALRESFEKFSVFALAYFAAASFNELRQRLTEPPEQGWAWDGFLGADDPLLRTVIGEAGSRARACSSVAFRSWLIGAIGPRDAVGLSSPRRSNLYPVDLETLMERSNVLGIERHELEARIPRLRSGAT